MSKKLYVGNLLYEVNDEDLKTQFSTVGTVVTATVIKFRDSGRSKGFGFVEMSTEEEAKKAIETMNGQDFKGRRLVVSEARPPRDDRQRQFGGVPSEPSVKETVTEQSAVDEAVVTEEQPQV